MQGKVLAQRWRLLSELGKGGMGSVWRAQHVELDTPAAVKLIDPVIADSQEALARFKREAQAAASLRSVNVVQILDYGVDDGLPYIAMELLDGESLADCLKRHSRLDPTYLGWVFSQVGKAVGRAHERGIVHRDLKPDNIFLSRDGDDEVVKVLDFGIAKSSKAMQITGAVQTRTGSMLGTPYYMSPEQTTGARSVNHRTDIWALGIIAYECLVGKKPFGGETLGALAVAICTQPIPVPSQEAVVPPGFDEWFARAACRDLDRRFQSVNEAVAALLQICGVTGARGSVVDLTGPGMGRITPAPPGQERPSGGVAALAHPGSVGGVAAAAQMGPGYPHAASLPGPQHTAAPSAVTVAIPGHRSALPLVLGAVAALALLGGAVGGVAALLRGDGDTSAAAGPELGAPTAPAASTDDSPFTVQPLVDVSPSASLPGVQVAEQQNASDGERAGDATRASETAGKSSATTVRPRGSTPAVPAAKPPAPTRPPSDNRKLEDKLAF